MWIISFVFETNSGPLLTCRLVTCPKESAWGWRERLGWTRRLGCCPRSCTRLWGTSIHDVRTGGGLNNTTYTRLVLNTTHKNIIFLGRVWWGTYIHSFSSMLAYVRCEGEDSNFRKTVENVTLLIGTDLHNYLTSATVERGYEKTWVVGRFLHWIFLPLSAISWILQVQHFNQGGWMWLKLLHVVQSR